MKDKKETILKVAKVGRTLERAVKDLNFHFITEQFSFEDDGSKKRIIFTNEYEEKNVLYEIDKADDKIWNYDTYNLSTMKSNVKDKLNSFMFKGKIKPFPITKEGQIVVIFIPKLQSKKGIVIDPCRFSDQALIQIDGKGTQMIDKELLGVIG